MSVSFIFDDRIRLAEFARHEEREQAAKLALEAYKASYKHAFSALPPWHLTRLGHLRR